MNIKNLGLEELSLSEQKKVNGGADYIVLTNGTSNGLILTMQGIYNAGAWAWNCITGQKGGYRYITANA